MTFCYEQAKPKLKVKGEGMCDDAGDAVEEEGEEADVDTYTTGLVMARGWMSSTLVVIGISAADQHYLLGTQGQLAYPKSTLMGYGARLV